MLNLLAVQEEELTEIPWCAMEPLGIFQAILKLLPHLKKLTFEDQSTAHMDLFINFANWYYDKYMNAGKELR